MSKVCKLTPTITQRDGRNVTEHNSKLFKDIKKAVGDVNTAWEIWAYTKTDSFRSEYRNLEFDELGEVTFPSLVKALGLETEYDESKELDAVIDEHNLKNRVIADPVEAVSEIDSFNAKEKRFIAFLEKNGEGFAVKVEKKNGGNIQTASEQSFNQQLSKEILSFLRSLGFDISFTSNPKFNGLFDPTNATFYNGLVQIIKLAKGEQGEKALPEEFAHLIIEGLINHPLVARLINSLDDTQIREILGDSYDSYAREYDNDSYKLKKEAAGKLLAQYITEKGTINQPVVEQKKSLLSRIWNWVRNLFSKVSDKQLQNMRDTAHKAVEDIYNVIASKNAVRLIDRNAILDSKDTLYQLSESYNSLDKLANTALTISAYSVEETKKNSPNNIPDKNALQSYSNIREKFDSDKFIEAIHDFVDDAKIELTALVNSLEGLSVGRDDDNLLDLEQIKVIAKIIRTIVEKTAMYRDYLEVLKNIDSEENMEELGIPKTSLSTMQAIANIATQCDASLSRLKSDVVDSTRLNLLYNALRPFYKDDVVIGVGSKKDEILSLYTILDHASKDINVMDRWINAMSVANDEFLVLIDALVKKQQYDRDIETTDIKNQIAVLDKKLTDQGYNTEFMFEKDKDGVPTGRIISEYDWDAYNEDRIKFIQELKARGKTGSDFFAELRDWKRDTQDNKPRLIKKYIDPKDEEKAKAGKTMDGTEMYEWVPNPKLYPNKVNTIENLSEAEKKYYHKMLDIKRRMMLKIPHRGQAIYNAVYISKDMVQEIFDSGTSDIGAAVLERFKRNFVRRPDDLGFGSHEGFGEYENFEKYLDAALDKYGDDPEKAASEIIGSIAANLEENVTLYIDSNTIKRIITRNKDNKEAQKKRILEYINGENLYLVDADFEGNRIQKVPIYFSRRFKDMKRLSTDFTGSLMAYSAMAINYEKMDQVVDVLEVAKMHAATRDVQQLRDGNPLMSKFSLLGDEFKKLVVKAGIDSSIYGRLSDYIDTVVYEQRKKDEGTVPTPFGNIDITKTLDTIKDYTGLLSLGLNILSATSNLAVGKLQQWIEAIAGEYFTPGDYALAIKQYGELIGGCVAEMSSPIKKNKLSLLIQMFDPMGDYYESLRNPNNSKHTLSRILGMHELGFIGMNAGEHILHCQTMLAILNNQKLINPKTKEKISLYDALKVKVDENGVGRLELKKGFVYERDVIDKRNIVKGKKNPNYGKPLRKENGKIETEMLEIQNSSEKEKLSYDDETVANNKYKTSSYKAFHEYIFKKKRMIRKVNDSLNGAFNVNDKGALHRYALGRLILQFRQWMPEHYNRRFALGFYDNDLERYREGFYVTSVKFMYNVAKDLRRGKFELLKRHKQLSPHEQANLRRAETEITLFIMLSWLCNLSGGVGDHDRNRLNKLALYNLYRMKLEVGASMPFNSEIFNNLFQMLRSPMASIDKFEKFSKAIRIWNLFNEIQSGRYEGWSEWERDIFELTPFLPQLTKVYHFDESIFSQFEKDN